MIVYNPTKIEGNTWKDRYWGVYKGEGENWLLMDVREEIQREAE